MVSVTVRGAYALLEDARHAQVATPTKGQSIHNMFDPSLQSMLHQLPGHIIPQTVWKPTKGYTPALLPQDFLFRVQRPGPPTANGPTITVGPPSLKEAERLSVVRMLMLDEYCADHVPKEITIVVEWPEHRSFRVQITRPPLERCWSLSLLAHEISAVMRQWRKVRCAPRSESCCG